MQVFVLIFNARTENEGIHTIRIGDRNTVLMFEAEDDAMRFGLMLEAQDFPTATVEAVEDEEIKEFCDGADYDWELVPEGALALPPETNAEMTDWQPDANNSATRDRPPETEPSDIPNSELERIRRRLEGLL